MKNVISINAILFLIFFLFLSSCNQEQLNSFLDGYCGKGNHNGTECYSNNVNWDQVQKTLENMDATKRYGNTNNSSANQAQQIDCRRNDNAAGPQTVCRNRATGVTEICQYTKHSTGWTKSCRLRGY